jgi:hypothetical protein
VTDFMLRAKLSVLKIYLSSYWLIFRNLYFTNTDSG